MTIHIGSDHNGYELKGELIPWLEEQGYTVVDEGSKEFDKDDDYPDYGIKVAEAVAERPEERRGILICASGVGMAVVADKVPGVRAAFIHDVEIAKAARRDDDINVLALGAKYISDEDAIRVVEAWLLEEFSQEERHIRRIGKITSYEQSRSS